MKGPWQDWELKRMRKMASQGLTSKQVAKALGRGHPAVRYKACTIKPKVKFMNRKLFGGAS